MGENEQKNEACCCYTNSGKPCSIPADRCLNGVWYCHVHDPAGKCQAHLDEVRAEADLRRHRKPKVVRQAQECQPFDYVKIAGRFFVCLPSYPVTITRTPEGVDPGEVDPDRGLPLFEPPTKEQIHQIRRRRASQGARERRQHSNP